MASTIAVQITATDLATATIGQGITTSLNIQRSMPEWAAP